MGIWCLATILSLAAAQDRALGPRRGASSPLLDRVVVIGASASAGFGLRDDRGGRFGLARMFDVMLRRDAGTTGDYANDLFFLAADQSARSAVDQARARAPTLVVALDFLFWFGYGMVRHEADRLQNMERGLQYLERFSCPVLVATLPDMTDAVGKMLSEQQVPAADTMDELNRSIVRWVKRHKNAALVPLPRLVAEVRAGLPVRVRGTQLPVGYPVLQADQLHPTREGLAVLAVLSLDALAGNGCDLPPDHITWDPIALGRSAAKGAPAAGR